MIPQVIQWLILDLDGDGWAKAEAEKQLNEIRDAINRVVPRDNSAKDFPKTGYVSDLTGGGHKVKVIAETTDGRYVLQMDVTGEVFTATKDKVRLE